MHLGHHRLTLDVLQGSVQNQHLSFAWKSKPCLASPCLCLTTTLSSSFSSYLAMNATLSTVSITPQPTPLWELLFSSSRTTQRLLSAGFRLCCRLWGLAFAEKVEIPMWTNFLLLQPLVMEGGRTSLRKMETKAQALSC